jgi:hypothetical protein
MSEGGTYLCSWSLEGDLFRLWLDERPELDVTGSDFDALADELALRILEWNGDGEAVVEFPRGRPGGGGAGVLRKLRSLAYNEGFSAVNRTSSQYEGGICPHCQFGIGTRTSVPLEVTDLPKGDIAGVDRILPPGLLLSERFLALLSPEELAGVVTQPIAGTHRRRFFELIGTPVARSVGIVGAEYPEIFHQSWRCRDCARSMFVVDHPEFSASSEFLRAGAMPTPLPSVFVFDTGRRLLIGASPDRWKDLSSRKGTTGISTDNLYLIDDSVAVTAPELPMPDEFEWML